MRHIQKRKITNVILISAILTLSACGMKWPEVESWERDPLRFIADKDESSEQKTEDGQLAENSATLSTPPSIIDPFEGIDPIALETGGTLGSLGFNLESYLQNIPGETANQRIEKLESALIAVHKDLKVMAPVLQRLADVQAGRAPRINTAFESTAPIPTSLNIPSAPEASLNKNLQPDLQAATPSPDEKTLLKGPRIISAEGGAATVTGIRVGEHPDKIRIVFDVTAKTPYTIDLDNNENLMVVELSKAQWTIPTTKENFGRMPLLKSYRVDAFNGGQGNIFVLQMKKNTNILRQKIYPALSGNGSRIVIDLSK